MTNCLHRIWLWSSISVWFAMCTVGCASISIQPTCPSELAVGESGSVAANEIDPGAIPTYLWEVLPSGAGTFTNATSPTTSFTALQAGSAVIRLTASDGLFQVISQCTTIVSGPNQVAVSITANVNPAGVDQTVTLTCSSIGVTPAITFVIEQISGPSISLIQNGNGMVTLTPAITGSPQFQCIGSSNDGQDSDPATLTLTVNETAGDTGGGRR